MYSSEKMKGLIVMTKMLPETQKTLQYAIKYAENEMAFDKKSDIVTLTLRKKDLEEMFRIVKKHIRKNKEGEING